MMCPSKRTNLGHQGNTCRLAVAGNLRVLRSLECVFSILNMPLTPGLNGLLLIHPFLPKQLGPTEKTLGHLSRALGEGIFLCTTCRPKY
jgi:hypothetical protein